MKVQYISKLSIAKDTSENVHGDQVRSWQERYLSLKSPVQKCPPNVTFRKDFF